VAGPMIGRRPAHGCCPIIALRWMLAMTRLKYILALFVAVSWFASGFLTYLATTVAAWIPWISLACWIPLFFVFLNVLFRRRWKAVAIVSTALALAIFFFAKPESVERFRFWLLVQGFRIHVAPAGRYLSRCELIAFEEDGIKQQLGECETISLSIYDRYTVFYDTTGQFVLPPAQRTQGWKDAMYNFSPHCYLIETAVAKHLFEKFYSVVIASEHEDGC
jgi:hypothetical protein